MILQSAKEREHYNIEVFKMQFVKAVTHSSDLEKMEKQNNQKPSFALHAIMKSLTDFKHSDEEFAFISSMDQMKSYQHHKRMVVAL